MVPRISGYQFRHDGGVSGDARSIEGPIPYRATSVQDQLESLRGAAYGYYFGNGMTVDNYAADEDEYTVPLALHDEIENCSTIVWGILERVDASLKVIYKQFNEGR